MSKQWKTHNEGLEHLKLKDLALFLLRELGALQVQTEVQTRLGRFVDVVGYFAQNKTVAFECGETTLERMRLLKENFTIVVHLPYCLTPSITLQKEAILDKIEEELVNEGD